MARSVIRDYLNTQNLALNADEVQVAHLTLNAVFNVAEAFDARGGAADQFWEGGPFKAFVGKGPGVTGFLDLPVKAVQLVKDGHGDGEAAKVARCFAATHFEH